MTTKPLLIATMMFHPTPAFQLSGLALNVSIDVPIRLS